MRKETDSLGVVTFPDDVLYGASTQLAIDNFPVSGYRMPAALIRILGLVKHACATANQMEGRLSAEKAALIRDAAWEVYTGAHDRQFPVDVFQTGSGTSTNMNANEVIARRAMQLAKERKTAAIRIHANDDVNLGQSSNDVMPTVLNISVAYYAEKELVPSLEALFKELDAKRSELANTLKCARTHLMDATPMTLGQEFSGYAAQVADSIKRAHRIVQACSSLAIGGTAVGTGFSTTENFGKLVCGVINEELGMNFAVADNHFAAQACRDDAVEVAGLLVSIAASLRKIAGDIRLLSSGPRCGLAELRLPALQPGSSMMPGKVNPVLCESVLQVAHHVGGLCQAVATAGGDGQLELNANIPVIAYDLLESMRLLASVSRLFAANCVRDIEADKERCRQYVEHSLMLATNLSQHIGYDKAAEVVKTAQATGKSLHAVILEKGYLDRERASSALDPASMLGPEKSTD